jgi:hypothetical protein
MSKKRTLYKTVGFRVEPSQHTNKHCVTIFLDGQPWVVISPHNSAADAAYGASRCRKCLKAMGDRVFKSRIESWFPAFMASLAADFNYQDDDEILGVLRISDVP